MCVCVFYVYDILLLHIYIHILYIHTLYINVCLESKWPLFWVVKSTLLTCQTLRNSNALPIPRILINEGYMKMRLLGLRQGTWAENRGWTTRVVNLQKCGLTMACKKWMGCLTKTLGPTQSTRRHKNNQIWPGCFFEVWYNQQNVRFEAWRLVWIWKAQRCHKQKQAFQAVRMIYTISPWTKYPSYFAVCL
jgi:hypothetical protein